MKTIIINYTYKNTKMFQYRVSHKNSNKTQTSQHVIHPWINLSWQTILKFCAHHCLALRKISKWWSNRELGYGKQDFMRFESSMPFRWISHMAKALRSQYVNPQISLALCFLPVKNHKLNDSSLLFIHNLSNFSPDFHAIIANNTWVDPHW